MMIIIIIIATTFCTSSSLFNAVVSFKTCIREVLGSNLDPDSGYAA
jgi:hypothetical protein